MSKYTYKANLRGKLVTVDAGVDNRVYSAPEKSAKTAEFITGPETVGTATGKSYTDGTFTWIEIVRSGGLLFGVPQITVIYLLEEDVIVKPNPAYDSSKDTGAPNPDGSYRGQNGDTPIDTGDVTQTPGRNRVPVMASDGKTVYVLVPKPTTTTTTPAPTQPDTDNTKQYLTWGLYGVLALSIIGIIVILVQSANTKNAPKPISR